MSDSRGIRYPYPGNRENCCLGEKGEKHKGWVAKARWRLSDQIILVAAFERHSSIYDKYIATDNDGTPLEWETRSESIFKPNIWRKSFIPAPGANAGMVFDWEYYSKFSLSDGSPPVEVRQSHRGGAWGLLDCSQVEIFLEEGVRMLRPFVIEGYGGGPWFVLCGEVEPVLRAYKKFKQDAQSGDIRESGDEPYYGSSGVGGGGAVAGKHIFRYRTFTKSKIVAECHRRDLEAGIAHRYGKDPFIFPHFCPVVTSCHPLNYEKRIPIETQKRFVWRQLKNYGPEVGDRATYNWVGANVGFNQQLYPPIDKIGEASAKLQDVEFFFCEGCGPNEIECFDKTTGRMCCVDCCKVAKWIEKGIRSVNL